MEMGTEQEEVAVMIETQTEPGGRILIVTTTPMRVGRIQRTNSSRETREPCIPPVSPDRVESAVRR